MPGEALLVVPLDVDELALPTPLLITFALDAMMGAGPNNTRHVQAHAAVTLM